MTDVPRRGPVTQAQAELVATRTQAAGSSAYGQTPNARPVPSGPRPATAPTLTVVEHGTDGTVGRPTAQHVMWVGSATPTNAVNYDFWYPADV